MNEEKLPVCEEITFKWDTILPYSYELPFIYSPKFTLLNVDVCYFMSIDPARTYFVQLLDNHFKKDHLKTLAFRYHFEIGIKRRRKRRLVYYSSGYHFRNIVINFLSFPQSKLRRDYFEGMPVTLTLTISEYKEVTFTEKCIQTSSYLNASAQPGSLSEDLKAVLGCYENADVLVECGDEVIKGHSFIFNSRSDVFKKMIEYSKKIKFQRMDTSYFKDLICYLYTDELPELNYETVVFLYELADMYALTGLMSRCREYLTEHLTEMEACRCVALADLHSDEYLKEDAIEYILANKVYLHEVWNSFYKELPTLARDIVNTSRLPKKRKRI